MIRAPLAILLLTLALPPALRAETATPAAAPRPVVTEIVTPEAARLRSFPGEIVAAVSATLAFQTAGTMNTRPVALGDRVAAGQILATLDQITLSEDVRAAEAAAAAARAEADYAHQSFARAEELTRRGVASTAQMESATASRDSTAAALAAAEADLASARDAETFGTLKAPADGVIAAVLAEPGTVVSAGTPVVTLAAAGPRDALIDVPAEVLAILPADARFTIAGRADAGRTVGGHLRLVEPVAHDGTRSHRLRIALDPAEGTAEGGAGAGQAGQSQPFRLGSLVSVRLDLPSAPVVSLPRAAILTGEDGASVWRVGPGRKLERVPVTPGAAIGDRVVVTAGIAQGDEVLLRGIRSVVEGQIVGERIGQ